MSNDTKHDELIRAIRSTDNWFTLFLIFLALGVLTLIGAEIINALNRIAEALQ